MTEIIEQTYYQKSKQYRQNYCRNYYHLNKEKLKQKRDNYPQEKKDQIKEYQKQWRDNNKINVIKKRIKALNEQLAKYENNDVSDNS